jgi:hypothetical protein
MIIIYMANGAGAQALAGDLSGDPRVLAAEPATGLGLGDLVRVRLAPGGDPDEIAADYAGLWAETPEALAQKLRRLTGAS